MNLQLHPKLGVNPHLWGVYCPLCGKKEEQIVLLGNKNRKDVCGSCGAVYVGGIDSKADGYCQKCGSVRLERQPVTERECFKSQGVCEECRGHMKQGIVISCVGEIPGAPESPTPAGRPITGFFVIKEEAFKRLFAEDGILCGNDAKRDEALKRRAIYMDEKVCRMLGLFDANKNQEKEKT
jgi:hypothetical protein